MVKSYIGEDGDLYYAAAISDIASEISALRLHKTNFIR